MKITKQQLKQIIKEELSNVLSEDDQPRTYLVQSPSGEIFRSTGDPEDILTRLIANYGQSHQPGGRGEWIVFQIAGGKKIEILKKEVDKGKLK